MTTLDPQQPPPTPTPTPTPSPSPFGKFKLATYLLVTLLAVAVVASLMSARDQGAVVVDRAAAQRLALRTVDGLSGHWSGRLGASDVRVRLTADGERELIVGDCSYTLIRGDLSFLRDDYLGRDPTGACRDALVNLRRDAVGRLVFELSRQQPDGTPKNERGRLDRN